MFLKTKPKWTYNCLIWVLIWAINPSMDRSFQAKPGVMENWVCTCSFMINLHCCLYMNLHLWVKALCQTSNLCNFPTANGSKQGNFNLVIWLFCYALLFKSFDMEQSSDELQKILEWEWEEREMCVLDISLYVIFCITNEICLVWVRIYIYILW